MSLLSYQSFGQGPCLVLLHGLFGQGSNLLAIAKHFAADYRVIVPDLVNHGQSFHRAAMNYSNMAEDVADLLEALQLSHCIMVGHSMGGKVAMQFANDYPERVKALVVVDIAPVDYPPMHLSIIAALQAVSAEKPAQRRDAAAILAQGIESADLIQFLLKNFKRDEQQQWQWQFSLPNITASYPRISASPELNRVFTPPVLFIKGGDSDYISEKALPRIQKFYPTAQFKMIQGAGHWLHVEKTAAFLRLLSRFFVAVT